MLKTHIAVWVSLGVLFFYYLGYFAFGAGPSKTVFDSLVIGSAFAIFLTWARNAMLAIRSGVRDGTSNIMVSTWGVWTLLFLYFVWVTVFTAAGRPDSWRTLPIAGTFSCLFFLAGAYALLTPINTGGAPIPRVGLLWWIVGVAMGGIVAGSLITLSVMNVIQIGR